MDYLGVVCAVADAMVRVSQGECQSFRASEYSTKVFRRAKLRIRGWACIPVLSVALSSVPCLGGEKPDEQCDDVRLRIWTKGKEGRALPAIPVAWHLPLAVSPDGKEGPVLHTLVTNPDGWCDLVGRQADLPFLFSISARRDFIPTQFCVFSMDSHGPSEPPADIVFLHEDALDKVPVSIAVDSSVVVDPVVANLKFLGTARMSSDSKGTKGSGSLAWPPIVNWECREPRWDRTEGRAWIALTPGTYTAMFSLPRSLLEEKGVMAANKNRERVTLYGNFVYGPKTGNAAAVDLRYHVGRLSVRLVDGDGKPIMKKAVTISQPGWVFWIGEKEGGACLPVPESMEGERDRSVWARRWNTVARGTTDERGVFTTSPLVSSYYWVQVDGIALENGVLKAFTLPAEYEVRAARQPTQRSAKK